MPPFSRFLPWLLVMGCQPVEDERDSPAGDSGETSADTGRDSGGDTGGDSGETSADTGGDSSGDTGGDSGGDTGGDSGGDSGGDTGTGVGDELTVLTLNLHCFKLDGTSYTSNDERFAAIATTVAAEGIQAIAAQEACENHAEGVAMDRLADALGTATGVAWGTAWTPTHIAWSGTSDEAQEGVGLLVAGADPIDVATLDYAVQGTQERWTVAGSFATTSGSLVRLYTVHLDHDDADARRAQARQTAMHALVNADDAWGVLIAGDYNATAGEDAPQDLDAAGLTRLSAASDGYGSQIDHVYAPTPANFEVLESRLVFDGSREPLVSDHPGVLVHLRRGAPTAAVATRFAATYDTGVGHYLALRGDTSPLSWDLGWPVANTASNRWEAVFLGWPSGTLTYKWLFDDGTWETSSDHSTTAGTTSEVTPAF